MRKIFFAGLILLALAQWIVPGLIIRKHEYFLKTGKSFKFQTEPVDPNNFFKGKYIALNFKEDQFTERNLPDLNSGQDVFVLLSSDKDGFAKIKGLSTKNPSPDTDYLIAKVMYLSSQNDSTTVYLDYTFREFYLNEFKAPQAEKLYRESNRDSLTKTYALVKIKKGTAVIEDVIINNSSIKDLIK
jgi:uncharacterized membrane-anchored protein